MPEGKGLELEGLGQIWPKRKELLVFIRGDLQRPRLSGGPGFQGDQWGGFWILRDNLTAKSLFKGLVDLN